MKSKKVSAILPVVLILVSFVLAFYFYSKITGNLIATHWGANGQANGYSSKFFGLFFMPILSIIMLIMFLVLPKIDPYKKNFSEFKNYFQNFINIVFVFLFYLYCLTLFWNLNFRFNMIQFLSPAFTLLFYYAGVLMSHAKRNWFIGIRTPWTMSSPKVWHKTHLLGSKLFKLFSLFILLSLPFPQFALFFILVPILLITFFIFVYSYFEYRKLK